MSRHLSNTPSSGPSAPQHDPQVVVPKFGEFGVYMQEKVRKLKEQDTSLANTEHQVSDIFRDITVHVNGYTVPSHADIRQMVLQHGGAFEQYFTRSKVTHVICANLTNSKMKEWRNLRVVKPEWIVDSIREQRLKDWRGYRLIPNVDEGQRTLACSCGVPNISPTRKIENPTFEPLYSPRTMDDGNPENDDEVQESDGIEIDPPLSDRPIEEPVTEWDEFEKHQGRLSANPDLQSRWARDNSAIAPDFIAKYYAHSRLHHLSTWKAALHELIPPGTERSRPFPSGSDKPTIMHIDMDCFFVSVALIDRQDLRNKPVCVAHGRGPGAKGSEIASCNYVARQSGVKNGQWLHYAREACPELVVLPYQFDKYKEITIKLYRIFKRHADEIQPVSCDEALIDVSTFALSGDPMELAKEIRKQVMEETQCTASVGIGSNILRSKIATRRAKPDGQFWLKDENVQGFLQDLPLREIPGIGWAMASRLEEKKQCKTAGDIQKLTKFELQTLLGQRTGEMVHESCRGIDNKRLNADRKPRQSVGAEINWGIRFENQGQVEAFMKDLAAEVANRLKACHRVAGQLILKVRKRKAEFTGKTFKALGCGPAESVTKSFELPIATRDPQELFLVAWNLLKSCAITPLDLRGLGIQMAKLSDEETGKGRVRQARLSEFAGTGYKDSRVGPSSRADDADVTTVESCNSEGESSRRQAPESPTEVRNVQVRPPSRAFQDDLTRSQIDQAVLGELPESIRNELSNHFGLQQQRRFSTPKRSSKRRATVLRRHKNGSRPKKQRNTTLTQLWGRANEGDALAPEGYDQEVWTALPRDIRLDIMREKQREESHRAFRMNPPSFTAGKKSHYGNESTCFDEDMLRKPLPSPPPMLAGRHPIHSIAELRGMLTSWLSSSSPSSPLPDDVQHVTLFFLGLVHRDLDMLKQSLVCLRSLVKEHGDDWQTMVEGVVEEVQSEVRRVFDGARLEL